MKRILLLPHIKVQNANALSSPITIGFPAMTAWLGAVHALQLKVNAEGWSDAVFNSTAVISHKVDLHTYKGQGDYVYSIIGTGNPLDKHGERSSFIEEARCSLDVSLLIEYNGVAKIDEESFTEILANQLNSSMKMAGGDILSFRQPEFFKVEEGYDLELRKLIRRIMPGYALFERRELMIEAMENGCDALDALLEYIAVHNSCEQDEVGNVLWTSKRKTSGWIVPIATGFHGITELGKAKNQRDPNVSHRFAESVVTLGEFRMPHQINSLDEILWTYHTDLKTNLYLCQQVNQTSLKL